MKMAKKKKSKNQVPSCDKEGNYTSKIWPDLPLPLRSLISREPILFPTIYPKGETKSWLTKPRKCTSSNFTSPWLQLFDHDKETVGNEPHSLNIVVKNERWFWYGGQKHRLKRNPMLRYLIWMIQYCTIVDPHCSNPCEKQHFMRFTNAISFKGKLYVVSLQGTLLVIEDNNGRDIGITGLCKQRAVPSVSSKHYRECLVESDGKILLVFLISKKSVCVVDDVEVYKINDANLTLTNLESLEDTTLFLGANCCMAISARRLLGCKRNSIYFTHSSVDDWWVYDLETGTISPGWNDSSPMNSQFGFDPELVE